MDEKILTEILDHISSAVYIVGEDETIVYLNRAAEELDNLKAENVIGRKLVDVYDDIVFDEHLDSPCIQGIRNGTMFHEENLEWFSKGKVVNALTSTYSIMRDGKRQGLYAICDSITEMKQRIIRNSQFREKKTYKIHAKKLKNGTHYVFNDIIGNSSVMWNAIETAKRFAAKGMPVMLYGETGTGKEMFAQSIHNASPRYNGPFVAVNCAAIPETLLESTLFGVKRGAFTGAADTVGLFEKADGGTIFLDEINSLPLQLQAKLLRALQEKEIQRVGDNQVRTVNCRIISATNDMPNTLILRGKLREDLFYRLSSGLVVIPPLRSRGDDLDLLTETTLARLNMEYDMFIIGLTPELNALLHAYTWPGNVRELINVLESAYNLTSGNEGYLGIEHLPSYVREKMKSEAKNSREAYSGTVTSARQDSPRMTVNQNINYMVDQYEKNILDRALRDAEGRLSVCSRTLGISRQALAVKMKKYQLHADDYKK